MSRTHLPPDLDRDRGVARMGQQVRALATGGSAVQLAYTEFQNSVTVSATTEAAPTDVVTTGPVACDGSAIWVEFFSPLILNGATPGSLTALNLWEDATNIGYIGDLEGASTGHPVTVRRRLTPSAGNHTYAVKAWRSASNSTVFAGIGGGSGFYVPGYLCVSRA